MTFKEKNPDKTVDVFAICYNEERILPYFIKHYQDNFGANITFFDNYSTDGSKAIIQKSGCALVPYYSYNEIRDDFYLNIKNQEWKRSKADWVIVVDCDEFLEVDFDCSRYSIINTQGYDMLGYPLPKPFLTVDAIRLGVKNPMMSKHVMFRPAAISDINYSPGCHVCEPRGEISGSKEIAKLLHWKYPDEYILYERHKEYESRLSDFNKKYNFGEHYRGTTLESVKEIFNKIRKNARTID